MRTQRFIAALLSLAAVVAPAAAPPAAAAADATVYLWDQDLGGSVSGQTGGALGKGTLRKDGDASLGLRLNSRLFGWNVEFGYLGLSHASTVEGTFTFDGQSFTTGAAYSLDATVYEFFPAFNLSRVKKSGLKFIWGVKVIDLEASVSQGANRASLDSLVPVPQVGLEAVLKLSKGFAVRGNYKWVKLDVSGVNAEVVDAQAEVAYEVARRLEAVVGWRRYSYDIGKDEGTAEAARVDLEHDGLFYGVRLKF